MGTGSLKLLMFDCDGTLADSGASAVAAMQAAFAAHRLAPPEPGAILHQVGLPPEAMITAIVDDMDPEICRSIGQTYRQNNRQRLADGIVDPLFPGITRLLEDLRRQGYRFGVATGKGRPGLDWVLRSNAAEHHFETLLTADRQAGKPDPAMLFMALEETGLEADDCLYQNALNETH